MAKYTRSSGGPKGAWVKSSEVVSGTKCKLVSETEPQEGQFGIQNVAKIRFQGDQEAKNVNVNSTSINALIDAFGEDSIGWQGNILTAVTEKSTIAGKRVTILYLIPEGYRLGEDEGGYVEIVKKEPEIPVIDSDHQISSVKSEDLPF